jgi:hypothetical protein
VTQRKARQKTSLQRRVGLALPVRITSWDEKRKPHIELGCTYDVSNGGVRLGGLRNHLRVGDIVLLERGRNKIHCRVVWSGPQDGVAGQMGLQALETGRSLWEAELREAENSYELVAKTNLPGAGDGKRRAPRYEQDAQAEMARVSNNKWEEEEAPQFDGQLVNISHLGCQLRTSQTLVPGMRVRVVLNFQDFAVHVRGTVRHADLRQSTVGVEFSQIRRGDRRVLRYFLMGLAQSAEEKSATAGA